MLRYVLKSTSAGILSLFVLITITFFLMHAIPGGPFGAGEDVKIPPQILEKINEKYGLNDPLHVQYVNYLKNLTKGDLGISFKRQDTSVNEMITRGFPVTAKLGMIAVIFSVVIGVPLGIISAIHKDKWIDWSARVFSTVGISIPGFVLAVLLMYFFSVHLKWLPSMGLSSWRHYLLPVIGLSVAPIAYMGRLMRSNMLEALGQDYVRTARSKGVREFMVVVKHALKNSITSIIAYLGPLIASLLTGSFVIEKLFSIPGIGRQFINGIGDRDYSVVLGLTVFFGAILISINIIVDVMYALVDPRIKFDD